MRSAAYKRATTESVPRKEGSGVCKEIRKIVLHFTYEIGFTRKFSYIMVLKFIQKRNVISDSVSTTSVYSA